MNKKVRRRWDLTALMALLALLINLPIILMILNSLQPTELILARENIIPADPNFDNYAKLLTATPFLTYLRNSVVSALGAMVFALVCAVSAPSSLAIELADTSGITLLGFSRGRGFNVYTHPLRIRGSAARPAHRHSRPPCDRPAVRDHDRLCAPRDL